VGEARGGDVRLGGSLCVWGGKTEHPIVHLKVGVVYGLNPQGNYWRRLGGCDPSGTKWQALCKLWGWGGWKVLLKKKDNKSPHIAVRAG